jgi:hypothetical protein
MADTKISALPASTTPLAGTEVLPIVQSGVTKKVSADNLWAGRSVTFSAPVSATPETNGVVIIDTTGTNPVTGSGGGLLFQQQNSGGVQTNYASITGYRLNSGAHDIVELAIATGSPGDARPITKRMSFDTLGNVTVTNGNLVMGTSGSGIDFSATPGTGTSELLADYEEGTWTPVYSSGVTSPTYTGTGGYYTKIGRTVFFTFRLQLSGGTADANQVKIGGLPFTVSSGTGNTAGASVAYNGDFKTDGAFTILTAGGSTELSFWTFAGGALAGTATNIGHTLQAYGFYTVD